MTSGTRVCTKCSQTKNLSEFYRNPRGRDGHFPECKDCNRLRAREWSRNRRASDPDYATNSSLKSKYGITLDQYAEMLDAQGGGCAICGRRDSGTKGRRFHVDHDHSCCPGERSCGKCVRALLCQGCNVGIGSLGEDVDRLFAAAAYLLSRKNVLEQIRVIP